MQFGDRSQAQRWWGSRAGLRMRICFCKPGGGLGTCISNTPQGVLMLWVWTHCPIEVERQPRV